MTTISERATAAIGHNKPPKSQRVCCPNCEATFDINKVGKPRSVEQHRRFWALMKAAYQHWPEAHEEQFASMNDLRIWLTMKAGWREEVARIPISGMKVDQARMVAEAAVKAAGSHAAIRAHKTSIVVFKPVSIRFDKMAHLAFCGLNQAVEDVIKAEIGITGDELLEQAKLEI